MTYISQSLPLQQNSWAPFLLQLGAGVRSLFNEIDSHRRMKASLVDLSAKDLRDIGLTRNDVTSIGDLPLPSSGALELVQTAGSRAGNW